jgi:PAS domain S-box-containing protein
MTHSESLRILVVEDNPGDFFLVGEYLKEGPWQLSISHAQRLSDGISQSRFNQFDLVLLDLSLPDSSGIEGVRRMLQTLNQVPLVVLTGMEDERYGVESMQLGAQDYLVKDQLNAPMLNKAIRYSIERARVRRIMSKQDRLFRVLTENSPTAKALMRPEGTFIFCTSSVRSVIGYDADDLLGKNAREIIHQEDIPELQAVIDLVLANPDKQPDLELRVKDSDGGYRWFQMGLANLLHDDQVNALVCTFWDITERRYAAEQIASSERRLSALIRSGSDLIWVIDTKGKFKYVSPNCLRVLGFQPDFLQGKNCFDFVFEEDIQFLREAFQLLNSSPQHASRPFRFRNSRGQWRWIETEMVNLLDDPAVNGIVFNSRDITEKVKAESELVRLSLIVEETPNAVVVTDGKGCITWTNRGFTNMTGYQLDEVLGKTPGSFLQGPDTDPAVMRFMRRCLDNQKPFEVEVLNYTRDRQPFWVRVQCQPLLNKAGELEQFFAIQTDITENKRQQELIKTSEERYRHLFEGSPAAILLWDPETTEILQVNQTAEREYGYHRQEFMRLRLIDIIADRQMLDALMGLPETLRLGQASKRLGVSRGIRRNGQVIAMERTAQLFNLNNREVVLMVELNVTEKVELEAALESERQARQQLVTDAVISAQEQERREIGIELHDNINQILASARLYLGLVQSTTPEPSPLIQETDKLINSAINEIRTLSHALIPPSLNESALLEALDHIIATTRKGSQLQITRSYNGLDESQLSEKLKLAIYRIVQEQFNNILKYAKASHISLQLKQDVDWVEMHIKDDGVGFDPSRKSKGVGLMNMRTRVSLFNGELRIITEPGKGCELIALFDCRVSN